MQTGETLHSTELQLQRGITFGTSCSFLWWMKPFEKKVHSKRKEFAPVGKNVSVKCGPSLSTKAKRMTE